MDIWSILWITCGITSGIILSLVYSRKLLYDYSNTEKLWWFFLSALLIVVITIAFPLLLLLSIIAGILFLLDKLIERLGD